MEATTIYYNPGCSKCRNAQGILDERGVDAVVIRYLDQPPTVPDLRRLMAMLGLDDPRAMIRRGERAYAELDLDRADDERLLEAISANPILLERPIVVVGERAVIARPPERVLELLE